MKPGPLNKRREPWQPILDGEPAADIWQAIRAVADHIRANPPKLFFNPHAEEDPSTEDFSLAGGKAGLAVFYSYLAEALRTGAGDEGDVGRDDKTANQYLDEAIDAAAGITMTASLYEGFTGVAWAAEHLQSGLFESEGDDETDEMVDGALRNFLARSPWSAHYDLISGLVGYGVYALERLPHPVAEECPALIVDRLEETAEQNREGLTWKTRPELLFPGQKAQSPAGCYNLGVAHGVPGVIPFLARVCAEGIAQSKTRLLLDGAVSWLLANQISNPSPSRFAYVAGPGIESVPARSAWCYGDPGIAVSLLAAARYVGEASLEREAIHIARFALERDEKENGIHDAGICHGAAGLGHIYNRLFQATGEPAFRATARFWLERTLSMRRPDQGIGGFSTWVTAEERWMDDPGLITGAAGTALALLASITSIEPAWDRIFMLSIPTGSREVS